MSDLQLTLNDFSAALFSDPDTASKLLVPCSIGSTFTPPATTSAPNVLPAAQPTSTIPTNPMSTVFPTAQTIAVGPTTQAVTVSEPTNLAVITAANVTPAAEYTVDMSPGGVANYTNISFSSLIY